MIFLPSISPLTARAEAQLLEDKRRLEEIIQIPEVTQIEYLAEDIPLIAQALPATSGLGLLSHALRC